MKKVLIYVFILLLICNGLYARGGREYGLRSKSFVKVDSPDDIEFLEGVRELYIFANASAGTIQMSLPLVTEIEESITLLFIKKMDPTTNVVAIAATTGNAINGTALYILNNPHDAVSLVPHSASHYSVISEYNP